ncbi:MAG: neutral/alkaline non-lysosomal ceramidase N-terminal domain-containing protein [Alphaproteobacteria bacterium]|nr:neutral/alkaline non-lysosomal ceramidase N-terminal domain-containing protein [Alphaproteobacteria bacterium]
MIALLAALACTGPDPEVYTSPPIVPGPPQAGAAEGLIDFPMGSPMGGYSNRCGYLGGESKVDNRASAYTHAFMKSAGVQTRPWVKALWLENGDDNLVVLKTDTIYSFDGLVGEVTAQLEAATGLDLEGRVVMTASHSHHEPANFSDQIHFYLGGDRFNEEVFERFAASAASVALEAWDAREPAAIGAAWARDWDPQDRVYRDRRGENNDLAVWDDVEPGYGKDPWLHMLRVDRADGGPIAAVFTFGIHGTLLDGDNPMWSTDAPGSLEATIQEEFDEPVIVMHLQGAGGDASPAGRGDGYARIESIGHLAADGVMALYDDTPVSTDPIRMETASRHIPQSLDRIQVTRDGAVDWTYNPYVEDYRADDLIYDESGDIISPLDEFNAPYGAAFCGSDAPLIPAGNIGSEIFPYVACMDVELMAGVLAGIFDVDIETFPLPLPESLGAGTTATRIGPLQTRTEEGEVVERDLFAGFFPAEPTGMFAEQWRRRARAELGEEMALIVGYAQDHEGYFLIPEDWLRGGYEPNINIWGPLQAEHVMEGVLTMADDVLSTTDRREDPDPLGWWTPTVYEDKPLPTLAPIETPDAGTRLDTPPEYLWTPLELPVDLAMPLTCRRVDCVIQLAWRGGDPAVDLPTVSLERLDGGDWVPVTSRSGRPITDAWADILTAHTPDPLYPLDGIRTHTWWAAWQAVGHVHDLEGLPTGTYRLRVDGHSYAGGATTWPWPADPYSVTSDPFELLPAELSLAVDATGLDVWIQAPPDGWRMVDLDGQVRGENPVRGDLELVWDTLSGTPRVDTVEATVIGTRARVEITPPADAVGLTVTDPYGNVGSMELL